MNGGGQVISLVRYKYCQTYINVDIWFGLVVVLYVIWCCAFLSVNHV